MISQPKARRRFAVASATQPDSRPGARQGTGQDTRDESRGQTGKGVGEFASVGDIAVTVRARRRQRLSVKLDLTDALFIVRSGVLALSSQVPDRARQILLLLFPGDVLRSAFVPALPDVALVSLSGTEALRLRWSAFTELAKANPGIAASFEAQVAAQTARQALHTAALGSLTGEERVAGFLLELCLRAGRKTAHGIAFDLPMSRVEIAEYLTLNPDTLSRIVSRLKAERVVAFNGRTQVLAHDLDSLCRLCPLAPALIAQHAADRAADPLVAST